MAILNEHGQQISEDLNGWTPPDVPAHTSLTGRTVRLEPLQRQHAIPLFHEFSGADASMWTYLPLGPFEDAAGLGQLIGAMNHDRGSQPYAVLVDGEIYGFLSFLRIQADLGVLEIGWIVYSPRIQRSTVTTETIALLLRHAFNSGYRRVEWKCDSLNEASREAATRFGFAYEGTFRKATHYKGRNRDTAWFAMTDDDWVLQERMFAKWLSLENFDGDGQQRVRLAEIR